MAVTARPACSACSNAAASWYSSFGSDFNYDFHVTLDQAIAPVEYNYRDLAELGPGWQGWSGEMFGVSAFLHQLRLTACRRLCR